MTVMCQLFTISRASRRCRQAGPAAVMTTLTPGR
jgi:hypothetical protein